MSHAFVDFFHLLHLGYGSLKPQIGRRPDSLPQFAIFADVSIPSPTMIAYTTGIYS